MIQLLRRLFAPLFARPPRALGRLAEERKGAFFAWFNLEECDAPKAVGEGRTRRSFRPGGAAFQNLVRLDLLIAADDQIVGAQLALDRSFVEDPRDSPFARDIAKSFLTWALRQEPSPRTRPLIDNIARFGASGATVITRAGAEPPAPPEDPTGGYAVYLGRRDATEIVLDGGRLALRNTANGRRWLVLDVTTR